MPEITKYGEISRETAGYAAKKLLRRGKAQIFTERFGQDHTLPKNHSQLMKFRRYLALNLAVAPLAEGVTPAGQKIRYEDVVVRLEQYGDSVGLTDVVEDTHDDKVLNEMLDLCSDQIKETIETVRFSVLKAGTNCFYAASAATRTALTQTVQRGDLRRIERSLNRNRAEKITRVIKATQLVATEPVDPGFYAICHTDLKADIEDLTDFIPAKNYSSTEKAIEGEIGSCGAIRFLVSTLYTPWLSAATSTSSTAFLVGGEEVTSAGNPDVYPIIILARDAYGIVRLQGENAVTPIVLNPNRPDKGDPLGQRGYVAWKMYQAYESNGPLCGNA